MSGYKKLKKGSVVLSVYEVVVLLTNYLNSIRDPEIGHNDAEVTIAGTLEQFKKTRLVMDKRSLESLLYGANMLDEKQEFWHPSNESFNKFIYKMTTYYKFDRRYNRLIPRYLLDHGRKVEDIVEQEDKERESEIFTIEQEESEGGDV